MSDPRDDHYDTASTSGEEETETESDPEPDSDETAAAHARALADGVVNVYPIICVHGCTDDKWCAVLCDGPDAAGVPPLDQGDAILFCWAHHTSVSTRMGSGYQSHQDAWCTGRPAFARGNAVTLGWKRAQIRVCVFRSRAAAKLAVALMEDDPLLRMLDVDLQRACRAVETPAMRGGAFLTAERDGAYVCPDAAVDIGCVFLYKQGTPDHAAMVACIKGGRPREDQLAAEHNKRVYSKQHASLWPWQREAIIVSVRKANAHTADVYKSLMNLSCDETEEG